MVVRLAWIPDLISAAAKNALAAAVQAVEAAKALSSDGEPELEIIVALHVGTTFYGNIGAADRLDFTVIGPAVNLVSRIEAVGKALKVPIICQRRFRPRLWQTATPAWPPCTSRPR